MAQPLDFKPERLEGKSAFECQLERAPKEHAEALLNLYALVQEAHDRGWLDTARGVIAGGSVATEELAKYINTPESITFLRNLLSAVKILGSIDPEILHAISVSIAADKNSPFRTKKTSLWAVLRAAASSDVLRGSLFVLGVVAVLGKALGKRH